MPSPATSQEMTARCLTSGRPVGLSSALSMGTTTFLTGLIAVGLLGKIVFAAMQKGLRRQEEERSAETDDRAGDG